MDTARLRNIGIVAHIDAGKTTVTERILHYTGVEHVMGEVHDGTATMDWMDEERERGITISAAVTSCPWRDHLVQIIDTPGHVDFTAEVARAMRVLDAAVVVLDAVAGVQAQTETVVRQARAAKLPFLGFINKMDRLGADFSAAIASLREKVHAGAIPVQLPAGAGDQFHGVLDLISGQRLEWDPASEGREWSVHQPDGEQAAAMAAARAELCGVVAELDEDWTDLYLQDDDLPNEILHQGLRRGTCAGTLMPVLCGSALRNSGIQPLLDAVIDWLPSPLDRPPVQGEHPETGRAEERAPDPAGPVAVLAFKVVHEKHGELVYLRVYSGTLRDGDTLVDVRSGRKEKLHPLMRMHADRREKLSEAGPGTLLAVPGLKRVSTGDTLCAPGKLLALEAMHFPAPVIRCTVEARDANDREKLESALAALDREDPTLIVQPDEDTGGWLLAGMGELHLEVAMHRLERDFKLAVRGGTPRVRLRETLSAPAKAEGVLEIPGDHSFRVTVRVRIFPQEEVDPSLELAPGLREVPVNVLREFRDPSWAASWSGPGGYPLAQVRVLVDAWDWEGVRNPAPEQLQGAVNIAVQAAMASDPQILEPEMDLVVEVPEEHLSAVLADLQQRRAEILVVVSEERLRRVEARAPLARLMAYSTGLRSQTQGKGTFSMSARGLAVRSRP
jgi:elongation factor G